MKHMHHGTNLANRLLHLDMKVLYCLRLRDMQWGVVNGADLLTMVNGYCSTKLFVKMVSHSQAIKLELWIVSCFS